MSRLLPIDAYVDGVRAGDRATLGRAITLLESTQEEDRLQADALIDLARKLEGVAPGSIS